MSKTPRAPAESSAAASDRDRTSPEHGRLATIGALTVGLGHDLRNAITPALLRLDALAASPDIREHTAHELRAIRSSIGKLQQLAAGLHLLSANPVADDAVPSTTSLSNWCGNLVPLVHAATSPGTVVQTDIPHTLGLVAAPPHVLAQVVLALTMNARELMQGNPAPRIRISARRSVNRVLLSFEHSAGTSAANGEQNSFDARLVDSPIDSISGLSLEQMRALLRAHNADFVLSEYSNSGGRFEIELARSAESANAGDRSPPASTTAVTPFSVLCIDDNELLIDALDSRLALEEGFTALHRAEPLTDSVAIVARVSPTIVLLDYDLPDGIDALEVLSRIVHESPASRVIVFTGFPNSKLVGDAMALGAKGFVAKGIETERLISAIHRVRQGERVIELDA